MTTDTERERRLGCFLHVSVTPERHSSLEVSSESAQVSQQPETRRQQRQQQKDMDGAGKAHASYTTLARCWAPLVAYLADSLAASCGLVIILLTLSFRSSRLFARLPGCQAARWLAGARVSRPGRKPVA